MSHHWMKAFTPLALIGSSVAPAGAQELSGPEIVEDIDDVAITHNVMVPMRDGVRLSTDVYRPAGGGSYPVILTRDPYDSGGNYDSVAEGIRWARRGFVFLHQDVRGRYDSEGTFVPYESEAQDTYDAQDWAAKQVWSDGQVTMIGGSYMASVQWLAAPLKNPAVVTLLPRMSPFNYYQDVSYPGGAFSLGSRLRWASLIGYRTNQVPLRDWAEVLRFRPLKDVDREALGLDLPHLREWIAHPDYDAYWQRFDMERQIEEFDVPTLTIAGWYDVFLRGSLVGYEQMRRTSDAPHKLIIGPWLHTAEPTAKLGDRDFGESSVIDFEALQARWLSEWMQGEETGILEEAPVKLFVMGENVWRDEQEWPLKRARYTPYYLRSDGEANTLSGDGRLSTRKPGQRETADHFTYDPSDPVPTVGGNLMFKPTPAGPYDQSSVETRDDVLVFSTPPLEEATEVTGPITAVIYAVSSARDTDFTAKLVDVAADGTAINLADGVIRARYRNSFEKPEMLEPGKPYRYEISLWSTSNLFKKDHRIRVEISSSNYPKVAPNPNTGEDFGSSIDKLPARQTILHDRKHPSHILLPIIPR